MKKILLIINYELTRRVFKKRFLALTFLTPLLIFGLLFTIGYISYRSHSEVDQRNIALVDKLNMINVPFNNYKEVQIQINSSVDSSNYESAGFSDLIILDSTSLNNTVPCSYTFISKKKLSLSTEDKIDDILKEAITESIYKKLGFSISKLDSIKNWVNNIEHRSYEISKNKYIQSSAGLAYGIGFTSGLLIYFTLFMFGTMVMRGVTEEKTNRISEIMVSCVKPFDLMLGKILGIGLIGLIQFLLWIILFLTLSTLAESFIPASILQEMQSIKQNSNTARISQTAKDIYHYKQMMGSVNWLLILSCFIFYFLGGYFFYSALFAAVGSASGDDPQDAQSLLLPITLPIILSFLICIQTLQNPSSSLAFWSSLIPFSSPLVMMTRIAYGIPETVHLWELLLSMVLLISGIVLNVYISSKIYRSTILMYGKKFNFKELAKLLFRK